MALLCAQRVPHHGFKTDPQWGHGLMRQHLAKLHNRVVLVESRTQRVIHNFIDIVLDEAIRIICVLASDIRLTRAFWHLSQKCTGTGPLSRAEPQPLYYNDQA